MNAPWSLMPLLPALVAFTGGILLGHASESIYTVVVPAATAVICLMFHRPWLFALCLLICLGFADARLHLPVSIPESLPGYRTAYSGVVEDFRETSGGAITMTVRIDSVNGTGIRPFGMNLRAPADMPEIPQQTRLSFNASAEPLRFDPDLPDEVDFTAVMLNRGISATAFITVDSILLTSPEPGLLPAIRRMRASINNAIIDAGFNDATSSFLITILTGDTSYTDHDVRTLFGATGLAHVLALSGLHAGIIAWIASLLLWPLYAAGYRRTRMVAIVTLLWGYAVMTGLSPSMTRAVIMSTVYTGGIIFGRRRSPFNSLCLAALIILVFSPMALFRPGFQMSVLAVASIILLGKRLNPFEESRHRWLANAGRFLSVPLSAMLGTGVVAAFYFHIFPVYFILSAALSAFLIPVLIAMGAAACAISPFTTVPVWLAAATDSTYGLLITITERISELPGSAVDNIYISPAVVACTIAAVGMLAAWLTTRRRVWGVLCSAWIAAAVAADCISSPEFPASAVYFSRAAGATNILAKNGDTLMLVTSAKGVAGVREAMAAINSKHRDFMRLRGIDSVVIAPDKFRTPVMSRDGAMFVINGLSYFMLTADSAKVPHCDRIIVCAGFRGNIVKMARDSGASCVLLGNCLDKRRHNRYLAELHRAGISCRSLKHSFSFQ